MQERMQVPSPMPYRPAVAIIRATLKYSINKIPVTTDQHPDQICGEARRIGYTGKNEHDLALYRLKIKSARHMPTLTLPNLYIIDNGIFQEFEQWQAQSQHSRIPQID